MNRKSSLKRKTPLRSKTPLKPGSGLKRSEWRRTKPPKDRKAVCLKGQKERRERAELRAKSPMKQISKKKAKALRTRYFPAQTKFLALPENRYCLICICNTIEATWEEAKEIMRSPEADKLLRLAGATLHRATEVHHQRGRAGSLIDDERFFIPSCLACRIPVHEEIARSRQLGLISSAAEWCVPVPKNS